MRVLKKFFQHVDYYLLIAVFLLCGIGLVMIYSASIGVSITKYEYSPSHFFVRQLAFFFVGLIIFAFTLVLPYQTYKKLMVPIVFGSIAMLAAVFLFGKTVNNAKSWIMIGGFGLQPAEFVKLGLAIYLAGIFSKKQEKLDQFSTSVIPPLSIIVIILLLIIKQPDFGTAMIVASVAGIVIFCSGMRRKHLFLLIGSCLAALSLFSFLFSGEQMSRFDAAYDPFSDPEQDGYQLINAYVAMAAGGLTGSGLGESVQKYGFLPEPHTDFIIAIIGEELGFLGIAVVLLLLAFIVLKGFYIGVIGKDTYGSLLAFGISGMIGVQSVVNLGAAVGVLPITGVPLPFVSYGGSSLILFMASAGILINISAHVHYKQNQPVSAPAVRESHVKAL
ncbi:putative lipid II flippase FtsW [Fictibacillus iocasae]|uniref:Probable peptidoglycan glycosyltransferase FtsW n=1 Tax=Fictibacillus iocasae TaxID=2715437 RepID=A0ABW2NS76_9BACL